MTPDTPENESGARNIGTSPWGDTLAVADILQGGTDTMVRYLPDIVTIPMRLKTCGVRDALTS